jgi:integrase
VVHCASSTAVVAALRFITRRLTKTFGGVRLDKLITRRIEAFARDRLATCKSSTVNMNLSLIRHLLSTARLWKVLLEDLCPDLQKVRADEVEARVITLAGERTILEACHARLRPLVAFGLYTGLRRNELVPLQWRDIDWDVPAVRVTSQRAKSRRHRQILLCRSALAILQDLPRDRERVFGYRGVGNSFWTVARRVNLGDVTPKSLRHTFATRCLERGVAIRTVQRWLGHASVRMTERYTHPSSAYEREMIKVLVPGATRGLDTNLPTGAPCLCPSGIRPPSGQGWGTCGTSDTKIVRCAFAGTVSMTMRCGIPERL